MGTINLERYLSELLTMFSFYESSESALKDEEVRKKIEEQQCLTLSKILFPLVIEEAKESGDYLKILQQEVKKKVTREIAEGLVVLRRQILESSHSIFEKYLSRGKSLLSHVSPNTQGYRQTITFPNSRGIERQCLDIRLCRRN
jgi:hypothetical protein